MKSVWSDTKEPKRHGQLSENIKTDVLIVGGGMAGILCAYMLRKAGVECVLLEAKRICSGITKNTTAKITVQHGLIYDKIAKRYGDAYARAYLDSQLAAFFEYKKLCCGIDCDYETHDSYVYSLDNRKKIENEINTIKRIGGSAEFSLCEKLPFSVAGGVIMKNQAQFNPLKFAYAISENLTIYENTKVEQFFPGKVRTNRGDIKYEKMIMATHFPIINKHGAYFIKMYQHRSYVLGIEGADNVLGMYVDESGSGLSLRSYKNLLLLGGGGHRTGKRGGGFSMLEELSQKYYPGAKIAYRWAAQDCMTLDGIPYIGKYSKRKEELYVATGFNKWGMTSSMLSAMALRDMICGKDNDFIKAFPTYRSILHPQLAVNIAESFINFITPTVPRCPHLGCALKYNREEHSWDCPCHGSRFSEDGKLLDNPATDDKRF